MSVLIILYRLIKTVKYFGGDCQLVGLIIQEVEDFSEITIPTYIIYQWTR